RVPTRDRLDPPVLVLAVRLPGGGPARARHPDQLARAARARARQARRGGARDLAGGTAEQVAIFTVLAIAAVIGFTKAETERIWLFFAPFVCLAAARALARRPELVMPVAGPGRTRGARSP